MPSSTKFRSLRVRILAPMVAAALLAVGVVAIASSWLGARWAAQELGSRFTGIEQSLSKSSFPLNARVLDLLAELTQTELAGFGESGELRHSTIEITASHLQRNAGTAVVMGRRYRVFSFPMAEAPMRPDGVFSVAVLFDEQKLTASRKRAALLPLVTGLSTIAALTTITLVLTSRLVRRIGKLQRGVEAVAEGNFGMTVSDEIDDEIGKLGGAVDSMAAQLNQLWKQINRQQSERLLHQIAGGMAHQLRNSLTGARMAVELHASECAKADDEGIRIAIHQIELSEDYVRRLLLVASGRQDEDRPMAVRACFNDVQASLSPIAKHLRVPMQWRTDERIADEGGMELHLKDGPTWIAAVTNLIHNAMQAGDRVTVELDWVEDQKVRVSIGDNGPGVSEELADELFEPFVTSKPEGMGLGLPLVRRAAEHLAGAIRWRRENGKTIFEFEAAVTARGEAT